MPSAARFGTVATQQGSPTVNINSYGGEAGGWTTRAINVSRYDKVAFELTITNALAAQLDLLVLSSDDNPADLDAFARVVELDASTGFLEPALEYSFNLANLPTNGKINFCINVAGLAQVRVAAKVPANSADVVLRYLGSADSVPRQSPDVV